jgi:RNA polymerase sigma-70 factor, ECF subfamily
MTKFFNKNNQINTTLEGIKNGSTKALKHIFSLYSERLFYYAIKFVNSPEIAEEIVQDVFIAIWENRKELNIRSSLESYLYTSVKNRSISYLRKKISGIETGDISYANNIPDQIRTDAPVEYTELNNELKRVIDSLPERCKIIFTLSRNSGLTYKQIADELNISPESVKTQIGIALSKLKKHLEKIRE